MDSDQHGGNGRAILKRPTCPTPGWCGRLRSSSDKQFAWVQLVNRAPSALPRVARPSSAVSSQHAILRLESIHEHAGGLKSLNELGGGLTAGEKTDITLFNRWPYFYYAPTAPPPTLHGAWGTVVQTLFGIFNVSWVQCRMKMCYPLCRHCHVQCTANVRVVSCSIGSVMLWCATCAITCFCILFFF